MVIKGESSNKRAKHESIKKRYNHHRVIIQKTKERRNMKNIMLMLRKQTTLAVALFFPPKFFNISSIEMAII
jgi:hypothetical protein